MTPIDVIMLDTLLRELAHHCQLTSPRITLYTPPQNPANTTPHIFIADGSVTRGRGHSLAEAIEDAHALSLRIQPR